MKGILDVIHGLHKRRHLSRLGRYLYPVRRISRVAPVPGRRLVAMTFDDGPTAGTCRPGPAKGLTTVLLDALAAYGARATFDIIGTTAENYPDQEGPLHTLYWSGVRYDHYPEFGRDELAGVVNQPELVRRMLSERHELANHGYRHIAFGPPPGVYRRRGYLANFAAVIEDLRLLHELVQENFGYTMTLGRPPHYIDRTTDGLDAYAAYAVLGYNYLAASFNGGGWQPTCGAYARDVKNMVKGLKGALERNPEALNGQIIFQKDGYNMSKQSPVADALPQQLEILHQHGYEVVTVSELLDVSPFLDLPCNHFAFPAARRLLEAGYVVTYQDNSFRPNKYLTRAELAAMLLPRPWPVEKQDSCLKDVHPGYPYAVAIQSLHQRKLLNCSGDVFRPDSVVTWSELLTAAQRLDCQYKNPPPPARGSGPVTRAAAVAFLGPVLTNM